MNLNRIHTFDIGYFCLKMIIKNMFTFQNMNGHIKMYGNVFKVYLKCTLNRLHLNYISFHSFDAANLMHFEIHLK